ncbi:hypothetical protein, conserved [Eimeria tenella]|uniref:Uncharacterized protein n=1 Tax=Eimeria tenella TaxID=5802 RepID=U6L8W2_EIMTE|nr:hypothetical protein, conserved [Eimeria tenella]CDJ44235.1 hypothetical protein, conserved [Eimeria tenella]|eukprot:XP_013234984.1 hypothetical protein, conserved [Eimeria tenella]
MIRNNKRIEDSGQHQQQQQQPQQQQQQQQVRVWRALQVSDMACVLPLGPPGSALPGSLLLLQSAVDLLHLLKQIREVRGAYGAWARTQDGLLALMTYRDPKPGQSLETFRTSGVFAQAWASGAAEGPPGGAPEAPAGAPGVAGGASEGPPGAPGGAPGVSEEQLLGALLNAVALMDKPVGLEARGPRALRQLLDGEGPPHRRAHRAQLLAAGAPEVAAAAALLSKALQGGPQSLVLVGPPEAASEVASHGVGDLARIRVE